MNKEALGLLKPGVMSLVVFSSISGALMAPNIQHIEIFFMTIICICLASGGCAAINMWYDVDIDSKMKRTKTRPTVTGLIDPQDALEIGCILSFFSVILMSFCVNLISSYILAFAIFFYTYIYTVILKRRTPQNIVIGGAAGAFPPVIGWTAMTGNIAYEPIILFMIIFLWTPPHFWALAVDRYQDYKDSKVPMLPNVYGLEYTKKQIIFYSILMVLSSLLPLFFRMVNFEYFFTSSIFNAYFLYLAFMLKNNTNYAIKLFKYSILYLFILFTLMIIHKI